MTHVRVAPRPLLSHDGRGGVVVSNGSAYLFRTIDGAIDRLETPDEVTIAALTPTASHCAVSGDDFLALWECGPPSRLLTTVPIEAPIHRMAVAGDLLVGVMGPEDDQVSLHVWRGTTLNSQQNTVSLGPSAVDEVQLDSSRGRVLVWGLKGPRVTFGEGEFFVGLFDLSRDKWTIVWQGEGAPREANGFLFPLGDGAIGAYDERTLTVLQPPPTPGGGWKPAAKYTWENLEQMVASPSGTLVAWIWSSGERADGSDQYRVRMAELGAGRILQDLDVERVGEFASLAVDDKGSITLAYGERPDRLIVCRLDQGRLRPSTTIEIPGARTRAI